MSQDHLLRPFLLTLLLQMPTLIRFVWSKECQKSSRKMAHKATCALQTTKPNPGKDPDEKAQAKKVGRWIDVQRGTSYLGVH